MEDNGLPSYEAALAVEQNESNRREHRMCEFDNDCFTPPSAPLLLQENQNPNKSALFGKLTNEEIREACYRHAEKYFNGRTKIIKEMEITNTFSTRSYHYKLETFTEKRQIAKNFSHYYKQNIDGPENGPEPDPWSIAVGPPDPFKEYEEPTVIPHSERVKNCHECDGRGKESCPVCEGAGWFYCKVCNAMRNGCEYCKSRLGRVVCESCNEKGQIKCRTCNGYKKLKHFKEIIVTRRTYVDHFVENSTKIPAKLLQSSTCKEVHREERPMIHQLENFHDSFLINEAALHIIQKHKRLHTQEEMIQMQRQTIRAVPITRVNYKYRGNEGEFYVFGFENSVYLEHALTKSPSCCIS